MKQEKPSIVSPCEGGGIIPPSVKSAVISVIRVTIFLKILSAKISQRDAFGTPHLRSIPHPSVYIRVIRGTILNPLC